MTAVGGQVAAKVKELENKLAVLMEKKKQAEKEAAEKARLEVSQQRVNSVADCLVPRGSSR